MATNSGFGAIKSLLTGLGLGAAAMYFLDPDRGRRRRSLQANRVDHWRAATRNASGRTGRDLRNRAVGWRYRITNALTSDSPSDPVLAERVRSELGRHVSHPAAIEVESIDGHVLLSGPVFADQADNLVLQVHRVRGVQSVEDRLERHESAENVPALQGAPRMVGTVSPVMQEHWNPATRLLVGAGGGLLVGWAMMRRGTIGMLAGTAGAGLLGRSLANRSVQRLVGRADEQRAIDVQKTFTVDASAETVYRIFSQPENFPFFMAHVNRVLPVGDGRYRWFVRGPAQTEVQWEARVTEQRPNEYLAWGSVPGSTVGNRGNVRLTPEGENRTRVEIRMTYNPPAGAIGHVVAQAFGNDPKTAMDEDMVRFKSLLEQGKTTAHGREVRLDQILH
jgi:uncharacterized membrane protein